jgi:glutathione peroxidase
MKPRPPARALLLSASLFTLTFLLGALVAGCSHFFERRVPVSAEAQQQSFHDFSAERLTGGQFDFSELRGKALLVVNVASECGLTPQYAGLQDLYETYGERGLVVLGFPSNDFGGQEPGTHEQIQAFCSENYGVSFPMFAKVRTKAGDDQSPIYAFLGGATGSLPGWNFGKYLVDTDGRVLRFFDSRTTPKDPELIAAIEAALP